MKIMVCQACNASDLDQRILEVALKHAKATQGEVIIVNSQMMDDRFHAKEVEAGKKGLASAEEFFKTAGITCRSHLSIRGIGPGEDIVKLVEEDGVDEIFVGLKKRSRLGKLLVGSTAQYLLLNSDCPVVSIK
jgi:nucleotide-binding universal stress UspA family protein